MFFVCTLNIRKWLTICKPKRTNLRFVKYQLALYISSVEIWRKINLQPFWSEALCLTLFRMLIHHHHH